MLFPGVIADLGAPSWAVDLDEWIDFVEHRSRFAAYSGLTDSWSGAWLLNGSGIYEPKANSDLPMLDNGLHTLPTRVNKQTNYNANPTDLTGMLKLGDAAATLTVVPDTAALATAGLSLICASGNVYKLDNSAGAGTATARLTVSEPISGPHVASFFARSEGAASFGMSETAVRTAVPADTTAYARFTCFDPDGSGQLSMIAAPGTIVWFILNQLEDGAFVTPPIVTTGSGVTRPGNRTVATTLDGNRAFVVDLVLNELVTAPLDRTLLHWNVGSSVSYRCLTLAANGELHLAQRTAGAPETISTGLPISTPGRLIIYGVVADGWMKLGVVGLGEAGGMTSQGNEPTGITTLAFGGIGHATTENTTIRTRRFAELRNVNNPATAFDKMKSIAQQW